MSTCTPKNQMHIFFNVITIFGWHSVFSPKVEIKNMDIRNHMMNFMYQRK
jgi:hypothetical protein